MLGGTPLIVTAQYKEQAAKWLKVLGRRECAAITFIPKTDRIIRLEQLVHDRDLLKTLPSTDRYIFQFLDIRTPNIDTKDVLYRQIADNLNAARITASQRTFQEWMSYLKEKKMVLILVIPEAETLLTPIYKYILSFLSYLYDENYPLIRILTAFEAHVTHPKNIAYLPPSTRLYQNVFTYPLYNSSDTDQFIGICETLFDIKVPQDERSKIHAVCGGHWWFVKEAVRQLALDGAWSTRSEGFQFRLNSLFAVLTDSEQSLIKKLVLGKNNITPDEKFSLSYFKNMNFVDEHDGLTIPVFASFIKNDILEPSQIALTDNHIYINHVPVDTFFSRKEHNVLKLLLENPNAIVTRDQIATRIWPINTQESYSDWAIDQLMKRLRKRLEELALSPDVIRVARGKGYLFNLPLHDHS